MLLCCFLFCLFWQVYFNVLYLGSSVPSKCDCCDYSRGAVVVCDRKGRRLKVAYSFATRQLDQGLAAARTWTTHTWGCTYDFLMSVQGCVRYTVSVALIKLRPLDTLPLLAVRLNEPGVAARCIEKYNSTPHHDEVTHDFFTSTDL
jgi:hypothetical protein